MAYSQKVVDKFEETLNNPEKASVGRWKPGDEDFHRVGTGIVGAPACGDVMKLQIKLISYLFQLINFMAPKV